MSVELTVVVPTHNPHEERFARTLLGLRAQTLATARWELLVIDNASTRRAAIMQADLSWHSRARVVREEALGLNRARRRGFSEAQGSAIVLVDDDNVLAPEYLERVLGILEGNDELGVVGGKCVGEYERAPSEWMKPFLGLVAVRDCGDAPIVGPRAEEERHPPWAPIGAGMALRRECAMAWLEACGDGSGVSDRRGDSLSSAGDCDIVLTVVGSGWKIGYLPELELTHLIPAARLSREYLGRIARAIAVSWVEVLHRHGIRPWPPVPGWSVGLRCARAWFRERAWSGPAEYVRWQAACGYFEGRARIR